MKKRILTSVLVLSVLFVSCNEEVKEEVMDKVEIEEVGPQLRHVVLFKFKDESSEQDIKKVEEAFVNLPNEISQIQSIEWGTNNSPEGLNQGLTHCFFLTFNSEEDRDVYLPHPAHKAFGELLGPHLDKVTVVDYWVKD